MPKKGESFYPVTPSDIGYGPVLVFGRSPYRGMLGFYDDDDADGMALVYLITGLSIRIRPQFLSEPSEDDKKFVRRFLSPKNRGHLQFLGAGI